jgi:hypothetical protein
MNFAMEPIFFASILWSVVAGIGADLAVTRGLSTILAQWAKGNSGDPMILLVDALLVSLVSAIACTIPAWHACKVDPMTALQCD